MNTTTDQRKKQRNKFLIGVLALLLVMSFVLMDSASAQSLIAQVSSQEASPSAATISETPEQPVLPEVQASEQVLQEADTEWQRLVAETQISFQKTLEDTNLLISDLSQQIERITTEVQPSVRQQIKQDLENRQDLLENLADDIDDLAEKVEDLNVADNSQLQNKSNTVQQSLENVAQTLNLLADNTEKAKKNSSPVLRAQIEQQIGAVRQALEEADQAIKVFTENPA